MKYVIACKFTHFPDTSQIKNQFMSLTAADLTCICHFFALPLHAL